MQTELHEGCTALAAITCTGNFENPAHLSSTTEATMLHLSHQITGVNIFHRSY